MINRDFSKENRDQIDGTVPDSSLMICGERYARNATTISNIQKGLNRPIFCDLSWRIVDGSTFRLSGPGSCGMAHERIPPSPDGDPMRSARSPSGFARIGLRPDAERATNLGCGPTSARHVSRDAITREPETATSCLPPCLTSKTRQPADAPPQSAERGDLQTATRPSPEIFEPGRRRWRSKISGTRQTPHSSNTKHLTRRTFSALRSSEFRRG